MSFSLCIQTDFLVGYICVHTKNIYIYMYIQVARSTFYVLQVADRFYLLQVLQVL